MAQKSVPGTTAAITFSIVIPNARVFPHRLVKELVAQSNDDEIIVVRNRPGSGRDRWLHLTTIARGGSESGVDGGPDLHAVWLESGSEPVDGVEEGAGPGPGGVEL